MTIKKMTEYINAVNERFRGARNHGNGGSWWYPKENVIAYCVKLHGPSKTIADIREVMTARQNEYYSDDELIEAVDYERNLQATMFSDDIDERYGVESRYAGRSGGWLEVEYHNPLHEVEEGNQEDLDGLYADAKALDKLEATIAQEIKESLRNYQQYINTIEFCRDIVDSLADDETIASVYKEEIKKLTNKLK